MITLAAPAKLTTSLRVLGTRPDGLHLIEAEMVSVSLADELELDLEDDGLEVINEVEWSGLPGTGEDSPDLGAAGNLVERALSACGLVARCRLIKRIPAGAGLGGGSADAAAVLRFAAVTDPAVAVRLGADVPFCVAGGRARVGGIGELVEPLAPWPSRRYLLVTPRLHVSTPGVYSSWDELGGPRGDNGNDLEPAALGAYPGLRWWRDVLAAASGTRPRLAGSGGTWFIEEGAAPLNELAASVRGEIVAGKESACVVVVETLSPFS